MANVSEVSDASFEQEVLKSAIPVLIDFWAPWCGPCKIISPVVEELAGEYDGKIKVVKMNVDNNPQTPTHYGVRGIPNLMIFRAGQVAEDIVTVDVKAIRRNCGQAVYSDSESVAERHDAMIDFDRAGIMGNPQAVSFTANDVAAPDYRS